MMNGQITSAEKARAVLCIQDDFHLFKDLSQMAGKLGLNIGRKAFMNVKTLNENCLDVKGGKPLAVKPNENFFKKFITEKNTYISLLPKHEDLIEKRFAHIKPPSAAQKHIEKTKKTFNVENKVRPQFIYLAIFSAYSNKPMSLRDVTVIARKNGYELKTDAIAWFIRRHKKLFAAKSKHSYSKLWVPTTQFFEEFSENIDLFCSILPKKKEAIISSFRSHLGSLPGDKLIEQAAEPEVNTLTETSPELTDDDQMIEAHMVGASIIAYINKLKRTKEANPDDYERISNKYEQAKQTIINQKNTIDNLNYQLEKVRKQISTNNEKIIELNHQLSTIQAQRERDRKVIGAKFKMADVARITKTIKGGRQTA